MKRLRTALTVTLFAVGVLAGCNDYNSSIQTSTGASLISISPTAVIAGTPSNPTQCTNTGTTQTFACFVITAQASFSNGFSTKSVVEWNGQKLNTTYVDTTDLTAQVPYTLVAKPGKVFIDVFAPQSGTGMNGLSNTITFNIFGSPNPVPTLSAIDPTSAAYCDSATTKCADVPITVTGTNFLPTSQNGGSSVTYTGDSTYGVETAVNITSISTTQLKATIPGSFLCAAGLAKINVLNPPSGVCLVGCPDLGGGDTNNPPAGFFTITGTAGTNTCPVNTTGGGAIAAETPAISQTGRYVAYPSQESGVWQVLLRDTCLGAANDCAASTRTVSLAVDGTAGNGDSRNVTMSADGRYVAFSSAASNLVGGAGSGRQVFVRDTCNGAKAACKPGTLLVSTGNEIKAGGTEAILPALSASGRFVAYLAEASGPKAQAANQAQAAAVAALTGGTRLLLVRDLCLGAANCTPKTSPVSLKTSGVQEESPTISKDGRYVTYASSQNGIPQILLRDTCLGAAGGCTASTTTISTAADGASGTSESHHASMTPDGRYIAFSSAASNFVENVSSGRQVYLRDTCIGVAASCSGSVVLVSTDEAGMLTGTESMLPSLSSSGRFIAFLAVTPSSARVFGAPNSGMRQVFVRDSCLGAEKCTPKTTRISLQPGDAPADSAKPAGPALAGLGKQLALADGKTSTVFTPTVPIDDRVFLAIPNETK